jgi:hypothetical protein
MRPQLTAHLATSRHEADPFARPRSFKRADFSSFFLSDLVKSWQQAMACWL